ncbi:MAG: hypothetical protein IJ002_02485 [Clostridia bacterium]|nr:hypothetical protein [Clostridia bacterium]
MKQKLIFFTLLVLLSIRTFAADITCTDLAKAIAAEMGDEPFVVRVVYGEMLINRLSEEPLPKSSATPTDSDMRAAAAALSGIDFSGGALNVQKLDKKSIPPVLSGGIRLYNWYFY